MDEITPNRLTSMILEGHKGDLLEFDKEFEADVRQAATHLNRCYNNLAHILTGEEERVAEHEHLSAVYLWGGANSLMGSLSILRLGYPIHALDLGRRVVECVGVAVYLMDHPQVVRTGKWTKLEPNKCVAYAKRHMSQIGRAYGFFSLFDHAHSAIVDIQPAFSTDEPAVAPIGYPVGPWSVGIRKPLFSLACLRLLATSHTLDGVCEMLFFKHVSAKNYWISAGDHIDYQPIREEKSCEESVAQRLQVVNQALGQRLRSLLNAVEG